MGAIQALVAKLSTRYPDDDRVVFNPNARLDTTGFQVRGIDQGVKFDPAYLRDPLQVKAKGVHGPRFIPTSDPNWTNDQVRQIAEGPQRPDIPVAKKGGKK